MNVSAAVYCPLTCCDWVTWGDAAADPLRTVCERRCWECCCMLFKCPAEFLLPAPSFRSAAPLTRAWKHNRRVSESSRGFRVQGKQLAGRESTRAALIRHRWPGLPHVMNTSEKLGGKKRDEKAFDILRWKRKVPIVPARRWCSDVFVSRCMPISSVCLVPFRHFLPDFLPFLTARYFKDAMLSGRKRLEVRGQCAAAEERCVAYQLIPGAVQESWREGKNKKCSRTNIEGGWRRTRCRCFQWGCLTSFSTSAPSGLPCLWAR